MSSEKDATTPTLKHLLLGTKETVNINLIQRRRLPSSLVGIPDATAAIQKIINTIPDNHEIDGLGAAYNVTSLSLKSKMRMANTSLKTIAGSVDMVSPITVDGGTSSKSNIELRGIHIDGNRSKQTAIDTQQQGEDGGRHGFRILGRVSDLLLQDCSAKNCATDGLELYRFKTTTLDISQAFHRIVIENFNATGNRRHGISIDSADEVKIISPYLVGNGLDLNISDAQTAGTRGARHLGHLYGNGIDIEGYGLGSRITNFLIQNPTAIGNAAAGILFFDKVAANLPGFLPRSNIRVIGGVTDAGVAGVSEGRGLHITSTNAKKSVGAIYRNVTIDGVRVVGGFLFRSVDNLTVTGGAVISDSLSGYALLDYATNVRLDTPAVGSAKGVETHNSSFAR